MATIKLKDAYYSVNIDGDDTCFLKFLSNWKLFNFVFLPNGLSQSPPKFTKLIMSPLAMLRMQGYTVAIYIDDIIPIDQSFEVSPYCGRNNKFVSKTELCNTSM